MSEETRKALNIVEIVIAILTFGISLIGKREKSHNGKNRECKKQSYTEGAEK